MIVDVVRQADRVGRRHDVDPLGGGDAPGRDARAHAVVEDLGRGARQRAEAGVFHLFEHPAEGPAALASARELHLLGRQGVHVQRRARPPSARGRGRRRSARRCPGARPAWMQISVAPKRLRLERAPHDLLDGQEVSLLAAPGPRERAEAARLDADVGEVDVAVDDVADLVADLRAAEVIGDGDERVQRRRRALRTGAPPRRRRGRALRGRARARCRTSTGTAPNTVSRLTTGRPARRAAPVRRAWERRGADRGSRAARRSDRRSKRAGAA